jgi:hypothetical protein
MNVNTQTVSLANNGIQVKAWSKGNTVYLDIINLPSNYYLANDEYLYRATKRENDHFSIFNNLTSPSIDVRNETIYICGKLAELDLEHRLYLPAGANYLEEQIILMNKTENTISLEDLNCGAQRLITNSVGKIKNDVHSDRFKAIPFLVRPTDPPGWENDFDIATLLTYSGQEPRVNELAAIPEGHGYVPSNKRFSEGWCWQHGENSVGIFKFNQEAIEFSVLAIEVSLRGVLYRFSGTSNQEDEPSNLRKITPGAKITMGITHLEAINGDYSLACYAFRKFLDKLGCKFPDNYNPPVHWNELYDNPEWTLGSPGKPAGQRMTRPLTYTRVQLLKEASSAKEYHCEALYLDPGWDTDFGTFFWGTEWLGERVSFIDQVWHEYGLRLSLHAPLATWMSWDGRGVASWPDSALRMDPAGNLIQGSICLGSKQYLDEAEKRLLEHCADGVVFLMFDGNWWNGGCWNPTHGHPIPYTKEDHCRANLDLAQRIHAVYPHVIIEMHDMIAGGSVMRYTPVYYKYGLPGSYDENWGFELMWQPMEDIRSGRARALYHYNMGCNIPVYLHIDLRDDNELLLVFWWYASTCRHLGIGGTHENPRIAQAHRLAMQQYRRLERFYKRGDFYGIGEEIHIHALRQENAFIVNLFNISDQSRQVSGTISFDQMGLDRDRWYVNTLGGSFDNQNGVFHIQRRMEPWSTQIGEVRELK